MSITNFKIKIQIQLLPAKEVQIQIKIPLQVCGSVQIKIQIKSCESVGKGVFENINSSILVFDHIPG